MNIRRGLFRVWILASACWITGYIWYFWAHCFRLQDDTLMCMESYGYDDWAKPLSYFTFIDYLRIAGIVLSGPVIVIALGAAISWAVTGFRQKSN